MKDHQTDHEDRKCYASPPCLMHEVDPAYMGLASAADRQQWADVTRWRKLERERLIKERLAISSDIRRRQGEQIAANLEAAIGEVEGPIISAYWPFRGEPDLRGFMERIAARGARTALPVVIARGQPLIFRTWAPGDLLRRGVWNIPVPAGDAELVLPDVVIAPVVGFDRGCYRLGYGGGYFDRTLAVMPTRPRIFGVGYAKAAIPTIYPQPHDIPMDVVVTEHGMIETRDYEALDCGEWRPTSNGLGETR
jgi:5,10-methenyltetrahydrofolate synthetase